MDGLNRYRFADDPNSLAEWESASNTVGRSGGRTDGRPGGNGTSSDTPPQGGEIKPAGMMILFSCRMHAKPPPGFNLGGGFFRAL